MRLQSNVQLLAINMELQVLACMIQRYGQIRGCISQCHGNIKEDVMPNRYRVKSANHKRYKSTLLLVLQVCEREGKCILACDEASKQRNSMYDILIYFRYLKYLYTFRIFEIFVYISDI